jgi:tetratricopeptide (TPR) repeat protein
VESAVTDTEKDSAPLSRTVPNQGQVQTNQETFLSVDNSRPMQLSSTGQTPTEQVDTVDSAVLAKLITTTASQPVLTLPVASPPKQAVATLHCQSNGEGSEITRHTRSYTDIPTTTTCFEQLEFVEHMYACFDFTPTDEDEGKEVCTDMEELTECKQQNVVALRSEQKNITENWIRGITGSRIEDQTTSNERDLSHSLFQLTISVAPIKPSGPLKSKTHRKLVQMLWSLRSSEPDKAETAVDVILMKKGLPLDIKLACLDAGLYTGIHNLPRLKKALEECDKAECQNPLILKSRIHMHIAACHLSVFGRVGGLDMRKHTQSALELSTQIGGDYSGVRAAGFKVLSDYERSKYNITLQRFDEILLQGDRNIDCYQALPEWMRQGGIDTYLSRVHVGNEKAAFYQNHDQTILQATLKATQAVLQQLEHIHSYLDTVQTAYYYHNVARLSYMQGDYPKAAEYGQLACNQYIQNSMHQRALIVAGQLHSSELEQQVMLAIRTEGL